MVKILFLSGSLAQNGTEMFMMNVLRSIDRNLFHIDFCINNGEITPNRKEAESLGCKVFVLPSRRENFIKSAIAFTNFFRKHGAEYNAIHWNGGNLSSILVFILAWFYKIPVRIVHAHSSSAVGLHNRVLHNLNRRLIPYLCNRLFACSPEASRFFYRSNPSVIINNGIDVNKFDYNLDVRKRVRNDLRIADDTILLGHVGRFDDNKNHAFMLDLFESFHREHVNSAFVFVGNGITFNKIKEEAAQKGLQDFIIFTGSRNDVNELMQAMDCFIMPSKFEGLPFVLIEAQCAGLPCVISDTISKEVNITDNVHFVSLSSDAQNWSLIINNVLLNTTRESKANVIIKKGFSITDTVSTLQDIYSNKTD